MKRLFHLVIAGVHAAFLLAVPAARGTNHATACDASGGHVVVRRFTGATLHSRRLAGMH